MPQISFRDVREDDIQHLVRLDELMSSEIAAATPVPSDGAVAVSTPTMPKLPTLGGDWFRRRCLPGRGTFLHFVTIAADVSDDDDVSGEDTAHVEVQRRPAAGFIVIHSHTTNRRRKRKRGGPSCFVEIFWLAVDPEARRRGVARALLMEARRVGRERYPPAVAAEHRLHVMDGNKPAIRLYEKLGFKTIAVKKGYPRKEYTALRMAADTTTDSIGGETTRQSPSREASSARTGSGEG